MRMGVLGLSAIMLGGCPAKQAPFASTPEPLAAETEAVSTANSPSSVTEALAPTRVLSATDAERLRNNQGLTLQWISWEERGFANVKVQEGGVWTISGEQQNDAGGLLTLNGHITEIGEDYLLIQGEIAIIAAPDKDRFCSDDKLWRFAVTQDRKYYRLREFEWCDSLTDYIDIYF